MVMMMVYCYSIPHTLGAFKLAGDTSRACHYRLICLYFLNQVIHDKTEDR